MPRRLPGGADIKRVRSDQTSGGKITQRMISPLGGQQA
jgi:hypothetical protein